MNKPLILTLLAGAVLGSLATAAVTATRVDDSVVTVPVTAGVPLPLDALVTAIGRKHGGRVTGIELERRPWGDEYEIELTDAGFREWDIVVDAGTGGIKREYRDFD